MQTFLPYADYRESAKVLDRQRLGKQRVECLQILKALHDPDYGWRNHPAVKMWRGYELALIAYGIVICREWIRRGYKDSCLSQIAAFDTHMVLDTEFPFEESFVAPTLPPWLTHELCRTHQSNLKRKDAAHYGPLFPDVPDDLEYLWPVA